MKNKVVITIETDGIITVESVESTNQFPCDEIHKENEKVKEAKRISDVIASMKRESAGNWLDEYIKFYEKIIGKQSKRERAGKSKFYYGDRVRITKTGKGVITLDKQVIGNCGTVISKFVAEVKEYTYKECHVLLDSGEPISFVISDPNSHYFIENFVELISDKTELVKEKTIPFNIDLWRKGDFKKVVTRDGREVSKLTDFGETVMKPLIGKISNCGFTSQWNYSGYGNLNPHDGSDLMLLIETTEQ